MVVEPLVKVQIYEHIYSRIKKGILSGEFLPGEKLNQDQLAQQMNVSRMPVRDALRVLEKDGLVVNNLNKGFEVTSFSEEKIKDVMYVRSILESEAVRSLSGLLTPADIKNLESILQDMRRELKAENNYTYSMQNMNYNFHFAIYNMIKSKTMLELISKLWESFPNYAMYMRQRNVENSLNAHEEIVKHLKEGEFDKAAEAMGLHILRTKFDYEKSLEDRPQKT